MPEPTGWPLADYVSTALPRIVVITTVGVGEGVLDCSPPVSAK